MTQYKLANGGILTDEEIEREAEEYEAGAWEGRLERIHVGRPSGQDEPLVAVTVKFPASMIREMDRRSPSRSDYIRKAVAAALL